MQNSILDAAISLAYLVAFRPGHLSIDVKELRRLILSAKFQYAVRTKIMKEHTSSLLDLEVKAARSLLDSNALQKIDKTLQKAKGFSILQKTLTSNSNSKKRDSSSITSPLSFLTSPSPIILPGSDYILNQFSFLETFRALMTYVGEEKGTGGGGSNNGGSNNGGRSNSLGNDPFIQESGVGGGGCEGCIDSLCSNSKDFVKYAMMVIRNAAVLVLPDSNPSSSKSGGVTAGTVLNKHLKWKDDLLNLMHVISSPLKRILDFDLVISKGNAFKLLQTVFSEWVTILLLVNDAYESFLLQCAFLTSPSSSCSSSSFFDTVRLPHEKVKFNLLQILTQYGNIYSPLDASLHIIGILEQCGDPHLPDVSPNYLYTLIELLSDITKLQVSSTTKPASAQTIDLPELEVRLQNLFRSSTVKQSSFTPLLLFYLDVTILQLYNACNSSFTTMIG